MRTALVVLGSALFYCSAADLSDSVRAILDSSAEARQCFWGIRVVEAVSGKVLFSHNDDKLFVPASNTKLFTTSLALRLLGPEHRFITVVAADAKPDAAGRIREVRIIGGGDPNVSARTLPYDAKEEFGPDALAPLRELAEKIAAAGIREVDGDVVGDDTAYVWDPYPPGWAIDDAAWEYAAPVSALSINDNALTITLFPGSEPGAPVGLALSPPVEYLSIQNRVTTAGPESKGKVTLERLAGSRELVAAGTLIAGNRAYENTIAVDDPALFAAAAFRSLLQEKGIHVTGTVRALHRLDGEKVAPWNGVEIARHESAPLSQIVQVINKVSQNLHAEMLLREIARVSSGTGTRRDGLKAITAWLEQAGAEPGQWNFEDASGLSRLTLVTPVTVTRVLEAMYSRPERDIWVASLPVGGVDGTLEKRFEGRPEGARIHAKTGSLSHVSALSGYADANEGARIFSILVNNYNVQPKTIRALVDRIALAILQ